jgi:hypothetical protein
MSTLGRDETVLIPEYSVYTVLHGILKMCIPGFNDNQIFTEIMTI